MTLINVDVQIIYKLSTLSEQSLYVVSISQTTHSSQPKLTGQTHHSTSFLIGFFLIFVVIGFLLGCFLKYKIYQKIRTKLKVEILKEVETLNRIEKMTHEIDEKIKSQKKQYVETLEKIWNMKP
ncbi:hypothetical protein HW132_18960 [Brasilonema sp. CT11]|nr:hypothetical protein [Brasilonema sp. CT11]